MQSRFKIFAAALLLAPGTAQAATPGTPCSPEWNQYVERKLVSGDGQGLGPDLGSDEWKGVVGLKLGIRGQPDLPARGSDAWCELIDQLVRQR